MRRWLQGCMAALLFTGKVCAVLLLLALVPVLLAAVGITQTIIKFSENCALENPQNTGYWLCVQRATFDTFLANTTTYTQGTGTGEPGTTTLEQARANGRDMSGAVSLASAMRICRTGASCDNAVRMAFYCDAAGVCKIEFYNAANALITDAKSIYSGSSWLISIDNAGSQATCLTVDDTGTFTYANLESCGLLDQVRHVEFREDDGTHPCAAGNYGVWADTSDGRLKVCDGGTLSNLVPVDTTLEEARAANRDLTGAVDLASAVRVCATGTSTCDNAVRMASYCSGGVCRTEFYNAANQLITEGKAIHAGFTYVVSIDTGGTQATCLTVSDAGVLGFATQESCGWLFGLHHLGFTADVDTHACTEGEYGLWADEGAGKFRVCEDGVISDVVNAGGGTHTHTTLEEARTQNRDLTGAVSLATAMRVCRTGTASCDDAVRMALYCDATNSCRIEFYNAANALITEGKSIYSGSPWLIGIDTGGTQATCVSVDDTGLWSFAALESCGRLSGLVHLEFAEDDGTHTCSAGNFGVWADTSENKLKACENGTIADLVSAGGGGTGDITDVGNCTTGACFSSVTATHAFMGGTPAAFRALADADIPDVLTLTSHLPLTGGALTGNLSTSGTFTSAGNVTIGDGSQATRTLTADLSGTDPVVTYSAGAMGLTGNLTVSGTFIPTGNVTIGDGSQATRTLTANLSGTDPVLSFASGSVDITGALTVTGNATITGDMTSTGNLTVGTGTAATRTLTFNLTGTDPVLTASSGSLGITGGLTTSSSVAVTGGVTATTSIDAAGELTGLLKVVSTSADTLTLTQATHCGGALIENTDAAGDGLDITLMAAVTGCRFCVLATTAETIILDPPDASDDVITLCQSGTCTALATGNAMDLSATVGSMVCFLGRSSTSWYAYLQFGSGSDGGAN